MEPVWSLCKALLYMYLFILNLYIVLRPSWDQMAFSHHYGGRPHTYIVAWKRRWSRRKFLYFLSIYRASCCRVTAMNIADCTVNNITKVNITKQYTIPANVYTKLY